MHAALDRKIGGVGTTLSFFKNHQICATICITGIRDLHKISKYKGETETDPQITPLLIVKLLRRTGTCESSDYL